MAKSENIQEINVGIVGHITMGTTLLSRITGKFTDTF